MRGCPAFAPEWPRRGVGVAVCVFAYVVESASIKRIFSVWFLLLKTDYLQTHGRTAVGGSGGGCLGGRLGEAVGVSGRVRFVAGVSCCVCDFRLLLGNACFVLYHTSFAEFSVWGVCDFVFSLFFPARGNR